MSCPILVHFGPIDLDYFYILYYYLCADFGQIYPDFVHFYPISVFFCTDFGQYFEGN